MSASLLPRLRLFFGLSQSALGRCLGFNKDMVSHIERGMRPLPMKAVLPQAALSLAYHNTAAEPSPEGLDRAALQKQQRACQLRAAQLAFELDALPARASWARRRLAALPLLSSTLTANGAPLPAWLSGFEAEAHGELARSGSTTQALLRLRIATLRFEAEQLAALLESEALPQPATA